MNSEQLSEVTSGRFGEEVVAALNVYTTAMSDFTYKKGGVWEVAEFIFPLLQA